MRVSPACLGNQPQEEEHRCLNSELWHACAGPLVSLPTVGSRVVYFPQGHSEQVVASTNKEIDSQIPNYPNLPPQLICQLHDVTMHADVETDEVYAQMTLQPLSMEEQKDPYLHTELGSPSKQPTNYFCKTLTASDTSTHGGFSVPRRAAEKVFPPLDFSQQPPVQELIAKDLHGNEWKFRHIFRGQPKRHLLTTGWSVFVSAKKLVAGDSVLFIWNENNQLFLGIRRANRPQTVMPSSVLSSDSMHIGLLAAAAHAAATNSRFTIFYNPRACPSEFVIPLTKYVKAVYHTRISVGMRFRMLFETEESSVRRYMGTITGIGDLDSVRWPNSHWRSVKVGWDESTAGDKQPKVSLWMIEPLTTFPMYPAPFPYRLKRPWPTGLPALYGGKDDDIGLSPPLMWLRDGGNPGIQSLNFQGSGLTPWIQPSLDASVLGVQPDMYQSIAAAALQEMRNADSTKQVSPSVLQLQQAQNITSRTSPLLPNQILQQQQPQLRQGFLHTIHDNQAQPQFHQHQLQHSQSFSDQQQKRHQQMQQQQQHQQMQHQQMQQQQQQQQHQQMQQQQVPQQQYVPMQQQEVRQQKHLSDHQQVLNIVSNLSDLTPVSQSQPPTLQRIPSFSQPQNFSDSNGSFVSASIPSPLHNILRPFSSEAAPQLSLPRATASFISSPWSSKRVAIESGLSSEAQCLLPQVEQLDSTQPNISQRTVTLAPFPGRESLFDQDGNTDPQNNILFGANMDSPSLELQSGISIIKTVTNENDTTAMPYAACNFQSSLGNDFPLNQGKINSSRLDQSGLSQPLGNGEQVNPQNETFVKVYKSGTFGRSLDITRFSSYSELRSELERMFGLEGQLEDPLRSGWQLVFVDRENDVLLVGDDPWQEFVNNVWCIKILSPQEVQQMGQLGLDLSSVPTKRFPSNNCDDFVSRQEARNLSTGITSVGFLEF